MKEKLVTIAKFTHVVDAHLARTKLESEGVECCIRDEHIVQMNWLLSNLVGGVKLQVKETDVDKAKEILKKKETASGNEEDVTFVYPRIKQKISGRLY
ncbi:MAG: DUF2007 domain-containing protein [Candidatus Omnitrophota bacterium]